MPPRPTGARPSPLNGHRLTEGGRASARSRFQAPEKEQPLGRRARIEVVEMTRQAKIFIATLGTPIVVGAVIVGAPAQWSRENPTVASGVIYRTETRAYSSSDLALAGLASATLTTRFGYPVAVRLNTHGGCLFPESAVRVKDSEFAGLLRNAPEAKLARCKGF